MAELPQSKRGDWKHIWYSLCSIVAIALAMGFLASKGVLYQWEMFGLDPLLRSKIFTDNAVRIIQISNHDYESFFKGKSPLDREQLQDLMKAVISAKPNLVVVDLDLSPATAAEAERKTFKSFPTIIQDWLATVKEPRPLIIWAQTVQRASKASKGELLLEEPLPAGVLPSHIGLPLFPRERDGMVRGYQRYFSVDYQGQSFLWPSLGWAAYRGGADPPKPNSGSEEQEIRYFNFSGDRYAFDHTDVSSILNASPTARRVALRGKTVFVGGDYTAARDEYFTPAGLIPGVDLIAYSYETETQGGGMGRLNEFTVFVIDILLGFLIVAVAYKSPLPEMATVAIVVALVAFLPIFGSYFVFHSWNLWLSFVPVTLGAVLHVAVDWVLEQRKELKKLRRSRGEEPTAHLVESRIDITSIEVNVEPELDVSQMKEQIAKLQSEVTALKSVGKTKAAGSP